MNRSLYAFVLAAVAGSAMQVGAQVRPKQQDPKPAAVQTHLPPPGMCRIWLENVPPAQQPAPTDCASAVRNQPRNARVLFGESPRSQLPISKSLKEPAPPPRKAPDEEPRRPAKTGPDGKPIKP